ncbi:hypothetical protein DTO271D3_3859 [Paecilomyces variotii]|nr:hypothetical protein DTO207G8_3616 [Paecilomyces variotii]KAJ9315881.1 hypothetical protein DTO271D3_3859 [Paecilomyces variotii]
MGKQLTAEQVSQYQKAFALLDRDKDGNITVKDLSGVMRSFGQEYTLFELEEVIKQIGAGKKEGAIQFSEFARVMQSRDDEESDSDLNLREAFVIFDRDSNGYISASCLRQVMNSFGVQVTDSEVDEMLRRADHNGDGKIDYEDFCRLMRQK